MKTFIGVMRTVLSNMKPALCTPISRQSNRIALASFGGCVVMLGLVIVMQLFMPGAWAWLWVTINVAMVGLYMVWFSWAVEGWFYLKDQRRQEHVRAEFEEMIKRL